MAHGTREARRPRPKRHLGDHVGEVEGDGPGDVPVKEPPRALVIRAEARRLAHRPAVLPPPLALVEQVERYEVGLGEPENPARLWTVSEPCLALPAPEIASLAALAPGASLWVRQKGSFAVSPPLHLTILS